MRAVAVCKSNFGTVRLLQGRYAEALAAYSEARERFETLSEPDSVATAWHQIGMVHRKASQFDQAERAYRQALAIWVQHKLRSGETSSLLELGNLYDAMDRLKEAMTFYGQAADICVELQDRVHEGLVRNNLANILIKLYRYNDARCELHRAIKCKQPYGHAAEPQIKNGGTKLICVIQ
ncbi:MAG: tetratricopeptide repeat protein [Candidatus Competibacteraceae bacterium]